LILIRDTARCDDHHFPATGLRRGDVLSFPRVNLSLGGATPTAVSNHFFDSPHPAIREDAARLEAACDQVIRMIQAMPSQPGSGKAASEVRVLKVIIAPWFKIIDGTGAFSTASVKLLRNRRFRSNYLGHAHRHARESFYGR
jgi:hypothetical protein